MTDDWLLKMLDELANITARKTVLSSSQAHRFPMISVISDACPTVRSTIKEATN